MHLCWIADAAEVQSAMLGSCAADAPCMHAYVLIMVAECLCGHIAHDVLFHVTQSTF